MEINPVGLYDATQEVEALYAALLDTQAENARLRAENERLRGVAVAAREVHAAQGAKNRAYITRSHSMQVAADAGLAHAWQSLSAALNALVALDEEREGK